MTHRGILGLAIIFGIVTGVGFSNYSLANVSLKNGNFFVGYTDIVYSGGFEPKVERVYNSKTPFKGIFGWGWGNEYEVYLTVSADGSVVAHEYGGGDEHRFSPVAFRATELTKAVDLIGGAAKKGGAVGTQAQLDAYKLRLKNDATFRNDEWEKYRRSGSLQARQLVNGDQLHSNKFSYQYITKVQGGYIRNFDSGKVEKFDESGRLTKVSDKNNNFVEIKYGKDGHPSQLVDNLSRKIVFSFNTSGLVERIEGENQKVAEYKYKNDELISSKDVDGNAYTYKYDGETRHNLVEVGYSNNTSMKVAYFGRDKHENVKSVKDRDGTLTEYGYDTDPKDSGHYSVKVDVKGTDAKLISSSKYEYFMKHKADGDEWTYKLISTLDGDRTETTYNECCSMPLIIKHGNEETTFAYDNKGHVTQKTTPTEITKLSYDQKAGKVNRVARFSKLDKKSTSWSEFQYDAKANLIFAKNSAGKGVKLVYDGSGRIKTLIDNEKRQISFKYNESSKPIEISDPSLGTITVSYTNSGEIRKVESSAGRKIALQVTSAFQNLLDIIRPAGVTLSL